MLGSLGIQADFSALMVYSIAAGFGLLALFFVLLAVKFAQDRRLYQEQLKSREKMVPISAAYGECQFCGCHKVRLDDKRCPVCLKRL